MRLVRVAGCLVATVGLLPTIACTGSRTEPPAAPKEIRILAGPSGFSYRFAVALQHGLESKPADFRLTPVVRPLWGLQRLRGGDVELAIVHADAAYRAFNGLAEEYQNEPFRELRAISLLTVVHLHLVVNPHTSIHSVQDLKGHRIAIADNTEFTTEVLLKAVGVEPRSDSVKRFQDLDTAATALLMSEVDALLWMTSYPNEHIARATRSGARLLPIDSTAAEDLLSAHGFLHFGLIPGGTYEGTPQPTHTIGDPILLICRRDLDSTAAYRLTREVFETLPGLSSSDSIGHLDLTVAPATPIPLHDGAARYYRERELLW